MKSPKLPSKLHLQIFSADLTAVPAASKANVARATVAASVRWRLIVSLPAPRSAVSRRGTAAPLTSTAAQILASSIRDWAAFANSPALQSPVCRARVLAQWTMSVAPEPVSLTLTWGAFANSISLDSIDHKGLALVASCRVRVLHRSPRSLAERFAATRMRIQQGRPSLFSPRSRFHSVTAASQEPIDSTSALLPCALTPHLLRLCVGIALTTQRLIPVQGININRIVIP